VDILIHPNLTKTLGALTVDFQVYDMIISVIAKGMKGMLVNDPNKCGRVTSPMIEKILEYRFLAELTSELYKHDTPCDVMRGDVDHYGYDLVIEANGILRHIQLKGITAAAKEEGKKGKGGKEWGQGWHCNDNLWELGSGCIVLLKHEEHCSKISGIKFFGGPPGKKLSEAPTLDTKDPPEPRAVKGKKPSKKVWVTQSYFGEPLKKGEEVKELARLLFGELPPSQSSKSECLTRN
jgi:hypothetical protein